MLATCVGIALAAALANAPCTMPDPAAMPRPIQLSEKDRVSAETWLQIERANMHLQRLAQQMEMHRRVALPAP